MAEKRTKDGVINFNGYRLFSLNYKCDPEYNPQNVPDGKFTYHFSYCAIDLPDGSVQVNLMVEASFGEDETLADQSKFFAKVEMGGNFCMSNGNPWDHVWDANAIAILYPYARAIVSTVTAQAGVDPIVLPTVNVAAMLLKDSGEKTEQE